MVRATLLLIAASGCRLGFDPVSGDAAVQTDDATPDAAIMVVGFSVNCAAGPRTAAQICSDAGFGQVVTAHAYHWFECGGPDDCPTGWAADGVSCASWCGAGDCVPMPYCGTGLVITERIGDGTLTVDPAEFYNCVAWNPGWLVRAQCTP